MSASTGAIPTPPSMCDRSRRQRRCGSISWRPWDARPTARSRKALLLPSFATGWSRGCASSAGGGANAWSTRSPARAAWCSSDRPGAFASFSTRTCACHTRAGGGRGSSASPRRVRFFAMSRSSIRGPVPSTGLGTARYCATIIRSGARTTRRTVGAAAAPCSSSPRRISRSSATRAAIRLLGDHGRPLGVMPTHLVVPPALREAGLEILNAERDAAGATNVWRGAATLLVVPWLA